MEAIDSKVYSRLDALYESRVGGSVPVSNLSLGRDYIESVLNTISGLSSREKFSDFARRMVVNPGDVEFLVEIFSASPDLSRSKRHLLIILLCTLVRRDPDIAGKWSTPIVTAVAKVLVDEQSEEVRKDAEELLLAINSTSEVSVLSGLQTNLLSASCFEYLIHLSLTKDARWKASLTTEQSFLQRVKQEALAGAPASLLFVEKNIDLFHDLITQFIEQLSEKVSEGQLRVILRSTQNRA